MAIRMQQRRGTAEQWDLANPVLAAGEIGFETDTSQFKIGDGELPGKIFPTLLICLELKKTLRGTFL